VNLEVSLNENRVIAADIPRYLKEKEEMEGQLKKAVGQLPNEKEIPDLIDAISSAGEEAGLKILIFRPGGEVPKGFYAEVPVSMSVRGRYESLYDFSVKVSRLPRIVNIGGMSVTITGRKGKTPVLSANFTATTFRFIPGPGEGAGR
jgi:type IV pilus assembly protein PilO